MSEGTLSTKPHLKEYRKPAPQTLKHRCISGHSTSYWLQETFCRQILRGKHLRKPAWSKDTFFSREQDALLIQLPKDACWGAAPDNKVYPENAQKQACGALQPKCPGHTRLISTLVKHRRRTRNHEPSPQQHSTQTAMNLGAIHSERVLKTVFGFVCGLFFPHRYLLTALCNKEVINSEHTGGIRPSDVYYFIF